MFKIVHMIIFIIKVWLKMLNIKNILKLYFSFTINNSLRKKHITHSQSQTIQPSTIENLGGGRNIFSRVTQKQNYITPPN